MDVVVHGHSPEVVPMMAGVLCILALVVGLACALREGEA